MGLSSFETAIWTGFALSVFFALLVFGIWMYTVFKGEGLKSKLKPSAFFLYIPILGVVTLLWAAYLSEAETIDSQNPFVLRTHQQFPALVTSCSESLVNQGVCAVWPRWIFYVAIWSLWSIPLSIVYGLGKNWSAAFFYGTVFTGVGLVMATIIGDTTGSGTKFTYIPYAFAAFGALMVLIVHILRLWYSFRTSNEHSWMFLYQNKRFDAIKSGKETWRKHFSHHWGIRVMVLFSGTALVWYVVFWILGPAGLKKYHLDVEAWLLFALDVVYLMIILLAAIFVWPKMAPKKSVKQETGLLETEPTESKIKGTRKTPTQLQKDAEDLTSYL
jgi:hypothetical protein